ncbi:MAG TPA: 4-(cytidine 5'-diphospho)-2-C-methyl-D-erythritol kinase [Actinomycetota bacterium]|nr:4-(cytidine 5'-diphospho)-2-C-methyl-D-erythritol kinase [Actinomycetota bacterium]
MKVLAPAKINLWLSVGARRPDGFHEIESVMQTVSVFDSLEISAREGIAFDVMPPGAAPEDESNLVIKSVRALWGVLGRTPGAALTLSKTIPVAAGLAGGSADAAAALVGLNELWDGRLSRKALEKVGAAIGSDVPFCVRGGTCAVRGRGEVLSPLPAHDPLWWVIAVPDASLSTVQVYAEFDRLNALPALEDPFELADALARGDVDRIGGLLRNDLQDAAVSLLPSLAAGGDVLRSAGAAGAIVSGSGPAWIGLCRDEAHAGSVADAVRDRFAFVAAATATGRGPVVENP